MIYIFTAGPGTTLFTAASLAVDERGWGPGDRWSLLEMERQDARGRINDYLQWPEWGHRTVTASIHQYSNRQDRFERLLCMH